MACNPLVTPAPGNTWIAWCKPHQWESPEREHFWQAKNDALTHQGKEPEHHPTWKRGPR